MHKLGSDVPDGHKIVVGSHRGVGRRPRDVLERPSGRGALSNRICGFAAAADGAASSLQGDASMRTSRNSCP